MRYAVLGLAGRLERRRVDSEVEWAEFRLPAGFAG
jgi:hypothetical protein